jgi:hypothetical protein
VSKGLGFDIEGDEKLRRAFRRAEDDIGQKVDRVERVEGEAVARDARAAAPRRKGALRGSVRSVGGTVTAGGSGVPYAGPIHFGWRDRPNPARGWRGGPIRPNPFLWDALDGRRRQVEQSFEQATREVVGMVNRT